MGARSASKELILCCLHDDSPVVGLSAAGRLSWHRIYHKMSLAPVSLQERCGLRCTYREEVVGGSWQRSAKGSPHSGPRRLATHQQQCKAATQQADDVVRPDRECSMVRRGGMSIILGPWAQPLSQADGNQDVAGEGRVVVLIACNTQRPDRMESGSRCRNSLSSPERSSEKEREETMGLRPETKPNSKWP